MVPFIIDISLNVVYNKEIDTKIQQLYSIEGQFAQNCGIEYKDLKYASKPELKRIYVTYNLNDDADDFCTKVYSFVDTNGWNSKKMHKIEADNCVTILEANNGMYDLVVEIENEKMAFVAIKYHVSFWDLYDNKICK